MYRCVPACVMVAVSMCENECAWVCVCVHTCKVAMYLHAFHCVHEQALEAFSLSVCRPEPSWVDVTFSEPTHVFPKPVEF